MIATFQFEIIDIWYHIYFNVLRIILLENKYGRNIAGILTTLIHSFRDAMRIYYAFLMFIPTPKQVVVYALIKILTIMALTRKTIVAHMFGDNINK